MRIVENPKKRAVIRYQTAKGVKFATLDYYEQKKLDEWVDFWKLKPNVLYMELILTETRTFVIKERENVKK